MELNEKFEHAQKEVKTLSKTPNNMQLLELYSLFKQGSAGDVQGKRPGMLDIKGRAKYDAWEKKKGISQDDAKEAYIKLVDELLGK